MRKTEEKTDAPPFIINTRESFVFFFYEREAIFKIRVVHPKYNAIAFFPFNSFAF